MALKNALLVADVSHARQHPKKNAFRYKVYYLCFALKEKARLRLPSLSLNRFNLFSFRDRDHGDGSAATESWMRGVLKEWNVPQADGDIVLLTMPRVLGYGFNPVSFWFCLDKQGNLRAVLSEVTNTFHDRHSYISFPEDRGVISQDEWLHAEKIFYVSPFLPVEGHYRFRFAYSEEKIGVWINYYQDEMLMLTTSLVGRRSELSQGSLIKCFFRYPLITFKVIGLIHYQALKIMLKGIRFISHPTPPVSGDFPMMSLIPMSFIRKRTLEALKLIRYGELKLVTPEKDSFLFTGTEPGPKATLIINDWQVAKGLAERGDIAFGEDYITGLWETDNLEDLIAIFVANAELLATFGNGNRVSKFLLSFYNRYIRRNSRRGSSKNIRAHYDVGNEFYKLWLDSSMTYSSGIYSDASPGLEGAQQTKYHRILDKLKEGTSLLEIGCGWGGFAEQALARNHKVTGVTISPAQHAYATTRLGKNADIQLKDYRDIRGTFDTIVSIEMFEAVGEGYWEAYFKTIKERLKTSGTAVIQTITIRDDYFEEYRRHSDFIRHYVFPGGMLPSIKRFKEEARKAGLQCLEVFSFGEDYARTLRDWLHRFEARVSDIRAMGYSEAFIRNWRFYLNMCAAAFAVKHTNVSQIELTHA